MVGEWEGQSGTLAEENHLTAAGFHEASSHHDRRSCPRSDQAVLPTEVELYCQESPESKSTPHISLH